MDPHHLVHAADPESGPLVRSSAARLVFLGLALYVPFLRDLFHFSTLHPDDLAICLAGGLVSILWFECLKLFKQRWLAGA